MERPRIFPDRVAAGRELAQALVRRHPTPPLLVLGLPRGGVPLAREVARALKAPLDVLVVRKVGMPGQPELAIGAIATGGILVREPEMAGYPGIEHAVGLIAEREQAELSRREQLFRPQAPPLSASGRTVILVDDGLATGATMVAAVRAARKAGATRVIAAAPVASTQAAAWVEGEADELVVLQIPSPLYSVGEWYEEFDQLEDADVCALLKS